MVLSQLDVSAANLRNTAMGHEGRAASVYWSSLSRSVPRELGFPGRRTRDAIDPFNQTVNYVYGLLYGEVWRSVLCAGLDPYAGNLHGSERDQGSLVFDVIEEFRAPFADRLALGMLGRGFRPHFGKEGELRLGSRRLLIRAFHRMWAKPIRWRGNPISPAQILTEQCKTLARTYLGEATYRPFQFRWRILDWIGPATSLVAKPSLSSRLSPSALLTRPLPLPILRVLLFPAIADRSRR